MSSLPAPPFATSRTDRPAVAFALVAYSVLDESLRLLQEGPHEQSARLSRRRRHVPLAVDRDGDVAATLFLRRGVSGVPWLQEHCLELTVTEWRVVGGGGGNGSKGEYDTRPTAAELGASAVSRSGGKARRESSRTALGESPGHDPWGGDWVSWAVVRATVGVEALLVDDRIMPLPGHGLAIVVWSDEVPKVTCLDAAGRAMAAVSLMVARAL